MKGFVLFSEDSVLEHSVLGTVHEFRRRLFNEICKHFVGPSENMLSPETDDSSLEKLFKTISSNMLSQCLFACSVSTSDFLYKRVPKFEELDSVLEHMGDIGITSYLKPTYLPDTDRQRLVPELELKTAKFLAVNSFLRDQAFSVICKDANDTGDHEEREIIKKLVGIEI